MAGVCIAVLERHICKHFVQARWFVKAGDSAAFQAGDMVVMRRKQVAEFYLVFPALLDANDNAELLEERHGAVYTGTVHDTSQIKRKLAHAARLAGL